jgi:hypothetical protein
MSNTCTLCKLCRTLVAAALTIKRAVVDIMIKEKLLCSLPVVVV